MPPQTARKFGVENQGALVVVCRTELTNEAFVGDDATGDRNLISVKGGSESGQSADKDRPFEHTDGLDDTHLFELGSHEHFRLDFLVGIIDDMRLLFVIVLCWVYFG